MTTIEFKYGTLIRGGPRFANGGKWDAELNEYQRNAHTNACLTLFISISFRAINPTHGRRGNYPDSDNKLRKIQTWAPGEFESFKHRLLTGAQRFWNGVFWLTPPAAYKELDWPDGSPTHHCNVDCRFELTEAADAGSAHYAIDVVRVAKDDVFRSHSRLYSQKDIQSENLIRHSTAKFWTHFHEVGHLLGLGHVNQRDLHAANLGGPAAYGVSLGQQEDVMGMGSHKHHWHAQPWQEAAATFTATKKADWRVSMHAIRPTPCGAGRAHK